LLLMSVFAVAATGSYLALAVRLFQQDKTELVYELNTSNVRTLAAETEAALSKYVDKVRLLTQGHREESWARAVFTAEPDLIAYTLYRPQGKGDDAEPPWQQAASVRNSDYLKLYGLDAAEVDRIREKVPVPFSRIAARKTLAWNSTLPGGAPVLSLGVALELRSGEGGAGSFHVAVVDVRLDRILKSVAGRGVVIVYIVDEEGRVIAHPDREKVSTRAFVGDVEIVREALQAPVASQTRKFSYNGRTWVGAYASVGAGGLTVVSQVEERQAFRAARRLIEKSLIFALLVVTIALFVSGLMARSLSGPLGRLLGATEKISRWDFSETVHVKSNDEIGSLARAFNAMAADLQRQHAELENGRRELEIRVRERTAQLENEKRRSSETQDALLRTTRLASVGELAGSAAHEILNPLNNMNIRIERYRNQISKLGQSDLALQEQIIGGWKESYQKGGWTQLEVELKKTVDGGKLLIDEDLENLASITGDLVARNKELTGDMEFLAKELVRVTRIINNMRSLSRVGGERRSLDVHLPLEETAATLADLLSKRGVALVKDYSGETRDLFVVTSDRDELVQVFSNLVRNALHAVDSAGRRAGEIRVRTSVSGDRIEVRVTDNGTGISAKHLPHIFEPTFTTKSVEEGTGLGLSISRRLVRAFGGDIVVESSGEGDGTTFLVWLPRAGTAAAVASANSAGNGTENS
jgi:signal transduction histidine kinase